MSDVRGESLASAAETLFTHIEREQWPALAASIDAASLSEFRSYVHAAIDSIDRASAHDSAPRADPPARSPERPAPGTLMAQQTVAGIQQRLLASFGEVTSLVELRALTAEALVARWYSQFTADLRQSLPSLTRVRRRVLGAVPESDDRGHVVYAYSVPYPAGVPDQVGVLSFARTAGTWRLLREPAHQDLDLPGPWVEHFAYGFGVDR